MKRLLLILILTISFQSLTKANDIRDFEIEGMSIGDSLLDYISKDIIENKYKSFYPKSDKYFLIEFNSNEIELLEQYSHVSFHFKNNDDNFIIYSLKGINNYENNLDLCLKKKNQSLIVFPSLLQALKKKNMKIILIILSAEAKHTFQILK